MSSVANTNWAPYGYGPVPFGGKPPPIPEQWNGRGISSSWQSGSWQINPHFNPHAHRPTAAWMPAPTWHQAHQQQQGGVPYNPYKRVVKPPSAEYLASKLSDNPLGLTNMVPREQVYGKPEDDDGTPHTPWVWNPGKLDIDPDDPQEGIVTAVYRDAQGNNIGRESRGPVPTRQSSIDRPSSSTSQSRNDPAPGSVNHHSSSNLFPHSSFPQQPQRHYSEPAAESSDRRSSSSSFSQASKSQRQPNASSSGLARANSMPTIQQPREEPRAADYTSSQPLRPTFSMNIIRTPEHYANSPRRSSSVASSSNPSTPTRNPTRSSSASSSMDSLVARKMSQLSINQNDSSSSETSISDASVFVDEPSSMLSPLMMTTPKPLASNRLGRHHTVPTIGTGLSAIPESNSRSLSHIDPSRDRDREREKRGRPANLESASYGVPPAGGTFNDYPAPSSAPAFNRTPPQERSRTSPHSYQHLTPPSSAPATAPNSHHNSHRTSPNVVNGHGPIYSNMPPQQHASAAARRSSSQQRTSPSSGGQRSSRSSPRKRMRKGFWNQRGDHLTASGYIVYAPEDRAYPEELRDYPDGRDGYRDEFGIVMGWVQREELEESLPKYGKPPPRPYESFVEYE
ncbi:hypothetical protein C8J56DRAFT_914758 [Mycena floridula]|nr:hypothetical protein C8J56DRAFT_914758 [Mycena floridula]